MVILEVGGIDFDMIWRSGLREWNLPNHNIMKVVDMYIGHTLMRDKSENKLRMAVVLHLLIELRDTKDSQPPPEMNAHQTYFSA